MANPISSYWDMLEPYFDTINIYDGPAKLAESVSAVPGHVVLLYATHMCQSEICNGGFLQLFWNNTGVIVPEAIEGFRTIGMLEIASLVEQAAQQLGRPYPLDRDDRWDALIVASPMSEDEIEAIFKAEDNLYIAFAKATKKVPFDSLEKEFYRLLGTENGGFEAAATRYAQSVRFIQ